ncbi:MAG TPA: IS630 family transposase [Desulfobacterales bacterium]|nr:IS630 family transposase [Desulfobacterales bacterium]
MWNLPKGHEFMREVSTAKLKVAYRKETSEKAKMRLLVAVKRRQGKSIDQIASDLEMGRRTVHSWLRRFVKRGLQGAYDVKQPGRPKRLTDRQLKSLRKDLLAGPEKFGFEKQLWTTRMVQEHVRRRYGVSYVDRHMRRLLRRMGFSSQTPRPVHYKADKRAQERFKKTSVRSWQSTENAASQ